MWHGVELFVQKRGQKAKARRTRSQAANLYEKIRQYEDEVSEHNATKSKPGEPTKYKVRATVSIDIAEGFMYISVVFCRIMSRKCLMSRTQNWK